MWRLKYRLEEVEASLNEGPRSRKAYEARKARERGPSLEEVKRKREHELRMTRQEDELFIERLERQFEAIEKDKKEEGEARENM